MNRIKNIFLTTCCSFCLVIIINCLFSTLFVENGQVNLYDIYMVLLTCIIVSLVINCFKFAENIIYSYLSMMFIIIMMEYLFYGKIIFVLKNLISTIIIMSVIFLIVYLAIYYVNDKDAKKINSIIKHRNQ